MGLSDGTVRWWGSGTVGWWDRRYNRARWDGGTVGRAKEGGGRTVYNMVGWSDDSYVAPERAARYMRDTSDADGARCKTFRAKGFVVC